MKSVMQHNFGIVPRAEISRSSFNRSHGYKTTFNSGYLVPIYVDEALPGDTFKLNTSIFARLSTPIVPVMDNLYMDTFFFAVPVRLLWDNWKKFNGEQKNPGDSIDFLVPQIDSPTGGFKTGSLSDYFGLPTNVSNLSVCSFWHRAYNLIYNEWFRDENLIDSVKVPTGDGPDKSVDFPLLKRCKRFDYFTSCLPWPQKGNPVELPLSGNAPIIPITTSPGANAYGKFISSNSAQNASLASNPATGQPVIGNNAMYKTNLANSLGYYDPNGTLFADLSSVNSATINAIREAFQLQRLRERDARCGTRYTEIIKGHFGVTSPDYRLQRPEFLGGATSRININPVVQQSSTDTTTPQGNLAAYGTCSSTNNGFVKSFTEHMVIIGLANVRADLTYQQGIPRMFSRKTRYDFYLPALSHLGEQAVLNKEIYAQGTSEDDEVFGYQERWAEYRYYPSQITGKMRSTDPQSLDVWHYSQKFENLPRLNKDFIQENVPLERSLAVKNEPQILFDCYHDLTCARPMPVYSTPGLVDHF